MAMDAETQLPEGLALTANLLFFDAMIRHQVYSLRFSGAVRNQIIEILNRTEREIATIVRDRLQADRDNVPMRLLRANKALAEIKKIRLAAWEEIEPLWRNTYRDFTESEVKFLQGAFAMALPVKIAAAGLGAAALTAIVKTHVFSGRTLKEWVRRTRDADLSRIAVAVRIGIAQGESSADIARRVVGTKRLRGRDGVTQTTRRNVDGLARTATTAFGDAAKQAFVNENDEWFDKEVFTATLDSRTTPVCRSLDGNIYERDDGPHPPMHFNCRSVRIPVISEDAIGTRAFDASSERILVGRYAEENGLGSLKSRKNLPRGHKGKFDRWARVEARKFVGQVPGKVTYGQWLARQPVAFQDDVLGVTRGKLFRDGGLTMDKFVDFKGKPLTLSQLAERDAAAFRSAGLNPTDFL